MTLMKYNQIHDFLEILRDYPTLWRKEDKDFNNRDVRRYMFTEIADKMCVTEVELKKRLKTMKDKMREVCSKLPRTADGEPNFEAGLNAVRWPFFEDMLFMKDQFLNRKRSYQDLEDDEAAESNMADEATDVADPNPTSAERGHSLSDESSYSYSGASSSNNNNNNNIPSHSLSSVRPTRYSNNQFSSTSKTRHEADKPSTDRTCSGSKTWFNFNSNSRTGKSREELDFELDDFKDGEVDSRNYFIDKNASSSTSSSRAPTGAYETAFDRYDLRHHADEWDTFAASICHDLRKITHPYLVMAVKSGINKIVGDTVLKQLAMDNPVEGQGQGQGQGQDQGRVTYSVHMDNQVNGEGDASTYNLVHQDDPTGQQRQMPPSSILNSILRPAATVQLKSEHYS